MGIKDTFNTLASAVKDKAAPVIAAVSPWINNKTAAAMAAPATIAAFAHPLAVTPLAGQISGIAAAATGIALATLVSSSWHHGNVERYTQKQIKAESAPAVDDDHRIMLARKVESYAQTAAKYSSRKTEMTIVSIAASALSLGSSGAAISGVFNTPDTPTTPQHKNVETQSPTAYRPLHETSPLIHFSTAEPA